MRRKLQCHGDPSPGSATVRLKAARGKGEEKGLRRPESGTGRPAGLTANSRAATAAARAQCAVTQAKCQKPPESQGHMTCPLHTGLLGQSQ